MAAGEASGRSIGPLVGSEDEISIQAAADLYRDTLELKRSELRLQIGLLLVMVAAAGVAVYLGAFLFVVVWAAISVVTAIRLAHDFIRLRRSDPMESWRRERRATREEAAGRADHQTRSAAVRPVATLAILAVTVAITSIQLFVTGVRESIPLAALVKPAVRGGEWWRLISAAFLHGNLMHLLMNIAALNVFGSLIETYEARLRVPFVYLAAAIAGSTASTLASDVSSLGASGGVIGLATFFLVSSGLQRKNGAARWIRQQVLSSLGATAVLGAVAFLFVDNAAHIGGAAAGMLLGWISANAAPRLRHGLDLAGWLSAAALLGAAAFTAVRLLP